MTAKEYLNRAYRIEKRIETKFEQLERLKALASKTTQAFGNEPVSHTRNVTSMEDTIVRILQAEEDLNEQIDMLVDTKRAIQKTIDLIADADCRLLLEMRYLGMKKWSDIGAALSLGRTATHYLHVTALNMVDTVLRTMEVNGYGA